jgi:hypothetical protein
MIGLNVSAQAETGAMDVVWANVEDPNHLC